MNVLFALTLPGLVVILTVAGVFELVVARTIRVKTNAAKYPVASAGFDVLGLSLAPETRHRHEFDNSSRMLREDEGEGAPPRSKIDLDAGTASIVLDLGVGSAK